MPEARSVPDHSAAVDAPRFRDRLLTEAVRCLESQRERALDDHHVLEEVRAITDGADDETFLVSRARLLPIAGELDRALERHGRIVWLVMIVGLIVTALLGAGTARAVLGVERAEPVNIFWLLGGVLGAQLLLLLAWVVLAIVGSRALAGASLGGLTVNVANWIARRVHRDGPNAAAIEASLAVTTSGQLGRWSLSAIVHALWASFNVGLVIMLVLLLSARQYTFAWESTILSADGYRTITAGVADVPDALGFTTPDDEAIAAARFDPTNPASFGAQSDDTRAAWSGLLVGSVVCYGLFPRLVLLFLCAVAARRAAKRYRLPLHHPAYSRLLRRRAPVVEPTPPTSFQGEHVDSSGPAAPRESGPPAIVGLELHPPATGWPPPVSGVKWQDFGIVEDRPARRRLIERLQFAEREPSPLIVVGDLTVTPDRGLARLLADVRGALTVSPVLVLTAGEALRRRNGAAEHVEQRVNVWRTIAREAGFADASVNELDLDHLTDASANCLRALVNSISTPSPSSERAPSRLGEAFGVIADRAETWQGPKVAPKAMLQLHESIAALYREDGRLRAWVERLMPKSIDGSIRPDAVKAGIAQAASRFHGWLPAQIRQSPKWAVAGALTGAVGCISAAALLSPVVIGALPMWSIVGGALGAIGGLRLDQASSSGDSTLADGVSRGDAIRSAALYALVLELQPRDEATISRMLARTIDDSSSLPDDATSSQCRQWLEAVATRYQAALTRERDA